MLSIDALQKAFATFIGWLNANTGGRSVIIVALPDGKIIIGGDISHGSAETRRIVEAAHKVYEREEVPVAVAVSVDQGGKPPMN